VKKLVIETVIFLGLIFLLHSCIGGDRQKLFETVKMDFAVKYPSYQFIECGVGEGDLVVSYVHVKFKKPGNDKILEEVWQYWDTDSAWLHRDKYLELTKDNKE
jgi:hypothetical protein